jgi:hypothetical protein
MGNIESGQILATMWDNFDARVKQICKFYHITKLEMAAKIGTTQSNLSVLNNGKQHHTDAYRILLGFPEINARWLLFGEGDMLIQKEADPQPQASHSVESVSMGDEAALYKYMYEKAEAKLEMREKEIVAAAKEYTTTITRLQVELEQLRKRNLKPYRNIENADLPMVAGTTVIE